MDEDDRHERTGGPTFDPPVYRQRYDFVEKIVREYNAKKVIDFGCSEGKLISQLKRVDCIEKLVGIDIDFETLEFNQIKAKPFTTDYLDPRLNPLTVSLYQGSIAVCDERFVDFDVIACVEIIEHLHQPTLEAMPDVVFGHLVPKVAIVTTPNSEFNVLFPDLKGFRHYDHKFEWTRPEFQKWSTNVATKYGYIVSFTGVGDGHAGTEHLGNCSQIAVFIKNGELCRDQGIIPVGQQPYKQVISCVHPHKIVRSVEECLIEELDYYTLFLAEAYRTESDPKQSYIPLEKFLDFPKITKLSLDIEFIRSVLDNCPKFELNEQKTAVIYSRAQCEWPSDDEDDQEQKASQWDSEDVGWCYHEYYKLEQPKTEEDWDEEMDTNQVKSKYRISYVTNDINKDGCKDLSDQQRTDDHSEWTFWRDQTATTDDRVGDDEEEFFADVDYTW